MTHYGRGDWRRREWQEGLDPQARRDRQQVALNIKAYYGKPVTLILKGGDEVTGFLRSTSLQGDPDPEFSQDPVTVELRNLAPIALHRIVGVLPGSAHRAP